MTITKCLSHGPLQSDGGGHHHPQVVELGLAGKRITHLSASLARATILTEDNMVAVLADLELDKIGDFIQVRGLELLNRTLWLIIITK